MEYGLPHDQLKKKKKDTPMGTPFNCSKKKRWNLILDNIKPPYTKDLWIETKQLTWQQTRHQDFLEGKKKKNNTHTQQS